MPTKIEKDAITGTETTGHEWDGIRELNTPLPKWWVYTFYATILFSVVYAALYPAIPTLRGHSEGLLGYNQREAVVDDIAAAQAAQGGLRDRIGSASLDEIRQDADLFAFAVTGGRTAFAENCAACHQAGGAGTRGYPSLADDTWLWGEGKLADIQRTIAYGIRSGHPEARTSLMPRFGADGILTPAQISAVADHVLGLAGGLPGSSPGAKLFQENCASCHGPAAKGDKEVGAPNLTDPEWIYGGNRAAVVQSITQGRNGSMPAWAERLDEATIKMLTLYVHALGGGR